jgi:hypothetical protein
LDAAVIIWLDKSGHRALLCLNDYSINYESLIASEFLRSFTRGGIIDPRVEEAESEALSFREDFDRKDEKGVIMKLHQKYDDRTLGIIPMHMHTATIAMNPKG